MSNPETPRSGLKSILVRLGLLLVLVAAILWLSYAYGGSQLLDSLAARESELRTLSHDHPIATLAVAFLLYVAVTGLSIPGATPLSLAYGWLFGFGIGVILVSFASTTGASLALDRKSVV